MAHGVLFTVDPDGSLRRMTPSAPETEDRVQSLVARYPELIADGDGPLLLIRREQAISDNEQGNGRWSVDHLFVTQDAVPVLVEVKRPADTRLRREVVGQMLDYAANATAYWQAGSIARSFAETAEAAGMDPETALQQFIGDQDPAVFWDQVDANFKAGRIKLVFVADEIPRELARVLEFLNDQMRADGRAVELRWFAGDGGAVTLSPRVIGETERAAAAKSSRLALPPLSCEEWLEKHITEGDKDAREGAAAFIALTESLGARTGVSKGQASIYAAFPWHDGKEIQPLHLWQWGKRGLLVSFTLRNLYYQPGFEDEEVRRHFREELERIVGPLTTTNLRGFPAFRVALLADDEIVAKLKQWLSALLDLGR